MPCGDVIGDYSFAQPLKCGDRLEFQDMAIYTMVKTNTFNGMRLPDIVLEREDGTCEIVKHSDMRILRRGCEGEYNV